jgi:hypothetical protein
MIKPIRFPFFFQVLCFLTLFVSARAGDETKEKPEHPVYTSSRLGADDIGIDLPASVSKGSEITIRVFFKDPANPIIAEHNGKFTFIVNGLPETLLFDKGEAFLKHQFNEASIIIYSDDFHFEREVKFSHSWMLAFSGATLVVIIAVARLKRKKA